MPDDLVVFALASLTIALVPGPDILYVVGRGVAQGRGAAVVSALALNTGAAIHASLAALGLSAIIQQSELAFLVIRYAGAAYLCYLAVTMVRDKHDPAPTVVPRQRSGSLFVQGVVTDLLNPKVYLFFLSFLPLFVDPSSPNYAVQMLVLGLVFVAVNLPIDLAIAVGSGTIGGKLRRSARASQITRWVSGGVLVGLAVRVAWPQRGS